LRNRWKWQFNFGNITLGKCQYYFIRTAATVAVVAVRDESEEEMFENLQNTLR
jgi:hypothetical protein